MYAVGKILNQSCGNTTSIQCVWVSPGNHNWANPTQQLKTLSLPAWFPTKPSCPLTGLEALPQAWTLSWGPDNFPSPFADPCYSVIIWDPAINQKDHVPPCHLPLDFQCYCPQISHHIGDSATIYHGSFNNLNYWHWTTDTKEKLEEICKPTYKVRAFFFMSLKRCLK